MSRNPCLYVHALSVLLGAVLCVDVFAQAPNLVIVSSDPSWTSAFMPLTAWLEGCEYDHEGGRAWRCEIAVRTDSSSVREYLGSRWGDLQQEGGGDLFAVIVVDPSHVSHPIARMIHDPEVAGESIGWGPYVASYDNFADMTGDGHVDVISFLLPAQSLEDCEMAVETALQHMWNQMWLARRLPPGTRRLESEPDAMVRGDPVLGALWRRWAAALDVVETEGAGRIPDRYSPHYFNEVLLLVEDHDRQGRSGALVEGHALAVEDLWQFGDFSTTYQGDEWPYNYPLREARANYLDNLGHQIKFIFGTENNRVNVANFQDQRESPPWSVDYLHPIYCYTLHVSMTCAHHAIHRPDNYGRPHAEQVLFLGNRGTFASLGMTAQIRQWPAFLLAEALTDAFRSRIIAQPDGATVGRAWRDAKNSFRQAHYPRHVSEAMSFCGLGWPFIRVVRGPGAVSAALHPDVHTAWLEAVPTPFASMVTIRYSSSRPGDEEIQIFDVTGRRVRSVHADAPPAFGDRSVVWDGRDDSGSSVPAGVYFIRLTIGGDTRKATVVRIR